MDCGLTRITQITKEISLIGSGKVKTGSFTLPGLVVGAWATSHTCESSNPLAISYTYSITTSAISTNVTYTVNGATTGSSGTGKARIAYIPIA